MMKASNSNQNKTLSLLLFLMAGIIPILMRATTVHEFNPFLGIDPVGPGIKGEIFTYYKFIFLIIMTVIIFAIFLYKYSINKTYEQTNQYWLPILVILSGLLISVSFADLKHVALFGRYSTHEGTISYLMYLILFFVVANTKLHDHFLENLALFLIPFTSINTILAGYNFKGTNLLDNPTIQKLLFPDNLHFESSSYLVTTLSNPNYLSGASAVLFFLFFGATFHTKNKLKRALFILMVWLNFTNVLFSFSSSGFITIISLLPIFLLFFFFKPLRTKQNIIILLLCIVLVFFTLVTLAQQSPIVWYNTFGVFNINNPFLNETVLKSLHDLFPIIQASASDDPTVTYYPSFPDQKMSAGSGRIYIWNETFKLILKKPIQGYGLDTLTFNFPQYNPEKYSGLASGNVLVDKPHNLYLQLWYGAGGIALFGFLLLLGQIFRHSLRWFNQTKADKSQWTLLLGTSFAILAYLVQGLVNDSVMGFSHVFWIILGAQASFILNYVPSKDLAKTK